MGLSWSHQGPGRAEAEGRSTAYTTALPVLCPGFQLWGPSREWAETTKGPTWGPQGKWLDFLAFGVIGGFSQWRVKVGEGKEGSRAQCFFKNVVVPSSKLTSWFKKPNKKKKHTLESLKQLWKRTHWEDSHPLISRLIIRHSDYVVLAQDRQIDEWDSWRVLKWTCWHTISGFFDKVVKAIPWEKSFQ